MSIGKKSFKIIETKNCIKYSYNINKYYNLEIYYGLYIYFIHLCGHINENRYSLVNM